MAKTDKPDQTDAPDLVPAGPVVATESEDLVDMTPREGKGSAPAGDDSRFQALREVPADERGKLVDLIYRGRIASVPDDGDEVYKGAYDEDDDDGAGTSYITAVPEEHIDIVVPSNRNHAAASMYLNTMAPTGSLTAQQRKDAAEAGVSPRTVHVRGASYHFETHKPTPVRPEHIAWLLDHENLSFERADGKKK